MGTHVIVGAGPVGSELARLLADSGREVISVTRSGRSIDARVRAVAADAADPDRLVEIATGAAVIYNCANPSRYGRWERVWPPLWSSMLRAAEATGATLASASSLYGYGPVREPMTESLPDLATEKNGRIRAEMWAEAKALHDGGRIRTVEVRASDYAGAGVGQNSHLIRNVPRALRGKPVWVIGDPDLPHAWTDVLDVARTLAAVGERPEAWGRVWLAPTNPPRSPREALADVLAAAGHAMVPMRSVPSALLRLAGTFQADLREMATMSYVFDRPYVVDSSAAERELDLAPTPWDEVCRRSAGVVAQPSPSRSATRPRE